MSASTQIDMGAFMAGLAGQPLPTLSFEATIAVPLVAAILLLLASGDVLLPPLLQHLAG